VIEVVSSVLSISTYTLRMQTPKEKRRKKELLVHRRTKNEKIKE
jgi:hypothetical protein